MAPAILIFLEPEETVCGCQGGAGGEYTLLHLCPDAALLFYYVFMLSF